MVFTLVTKIESTSVPYVYNQVIYEEHLKFFIFIQVHKPRATVIIMTAIIMKESSLLFQRSDYRYNLMGHSLLPSSLFNYHMVKIKFSWSYVNCTPASILQSPTFHWHCKTLEVTITTFRSRQLWSRNQTLFSQRLFGLKWNQPTPIGWRCAQSVILSFCLQKCSASSLLICFLLKLPVLFVFY